MDIKKLVCICAILMVGVMPLQSFADSSTQNDVNAVYTSSLSLSNVFVRKSVDNELARDFSYSLSAGNNARVTLVVSNAVTGGFVGKKVVPPEQSFISGLDPLTDYAYTLDAVDQVSGARAHAEGFFRTDAVSTVSDVFQEDKKNKVNDASMDVVQNPSLIFVRWPDVVLKGKKATVRWESDGDYCSASGAWKGKKAAKGMTEVWPGTRAQQYSLQCFTKEGRKSEKAHVSVKVTKQIPRATPLKILFTADRTSILMGESTTLSWNVPEAMNCESHGPSYWSGLQYGKGAREVAPEKDERFTLRCWNRVGLSAEAHIDIHIAGVADR